MNTRIIAAQIAVTRIDTPHPAAAAGLNRNLGSVGVALQSRVERPDDEPMALFRGNIAKEAGSTSNRRNQQVEGAIVIDVAAGQSARNRRSTAERSVLLGDI